MRRVRYFLMGVALGATACLLLAALAGCRTMAGLGGDLEALAKSTSSQYDRDRKEWRDE